MNVDQLRALEKNAWRLAQYTSDLVELETVSDLNLPDGFETREEYREHLGNMIGSHRILLGMAYNNVDEWQNV